MSFTDRVDAGRQLAAKLENYQGKNVIVVAIPRGGVVIGAEIATSLHAALSVVLVRKISHPYHAEYAVGAISEKGAPVYNSRELTDVGPAWLAEAEESARQLIKRKREIYFGKRFHRPPLKGKTVIIVDDGMATGLSMQAAVRALRDELLSKLIIAVPTASPDSLALLQPLADEIVTLENPHDFLGSVGAHYTNFEAVSDETVRSILADA